MTKATKRKRDMASDIQNKLMASAMSGKRRTLSKRGALAINRVARGMLLQELEELEQRAHRLGVNVTAHALNRAKNALGWEIAGNVEEAGKAARRV